MLKFPSAFRTTKIKTNGAAINVRTGGRGERIYLDRFWNELSADPKSINETTRRHYAKLYARPGAMHSAFSQFAAFTQDAIDNQDFVAAGKLGFPVLAIGAEKSFGPAMADELRFVATDVAPVVIPNSGHWLMEEQPTATISAIRAFMTKSKARKSEVHPLRA